MLPRYHVWNDILTYYCYGDLKSFYVTTVHDRSVLSWIEHFMTPKYMPFAAVDPFQWPPPPPQFFSKVPLSFPAALQKQLVSRDAIPMTDRGWGGGSREERFFITGLRAEEGRSTHLIVITGPIDFHGRTSLPERENKSDNGKHCHIWEMAWKRIAQRTRNNVDTLCYLILVVIQQIF